ncbi:hypothetical protein HPB52_005488 [Rhipicephalus sanguineus]|uniref:Methyltransferase type 11 domain-containing protein n=1 Tax=Rhipicephalus sanguineus TaxID=34632 RepID=A0A9D4PVP5_RHISA|nr:hypothetical protein HPB52_005488 [Rhipicephalus sanguineus]
MAGIRDHVLIECGFIVDEHSNETASVCMGQGKWVIMPHDGDDLALAIVLVGATGFGMSTPASENDSSSTASTNGCATDIYAVEQCAEIYDIAIAPTASAIAALLDFLEQAFLDSAALHLGPTGHEGDVRERIQFLDVGCGSGSFTKKHLLPRLPAWCERLVAVDNSDAMLKFAAESSADPRIEYRKLDILAYEDVAQFVNAEGRFQRVYSFLAFHWIAEHRIALKNIGTLLAPGGECFIVFSDKLHVFDVFAAMMESPRWKKYSDILLQMLPETRLLEDIYSLRSYLVNLLQETNLLPLACEIFPLKEKVGLSEETAIGE